MLAVNGAALLKNGIQVLQSELQNYAVKKPVLLKVIKQVAI